MTAEAVKLPGDARAEWRTHWPVVLAACAGVAISTINTYSLAVFMQPLQSEFGWSRAEIASGHTIAGVATVILAPFVGAAIDRFGPRRIGIPGVTALCCFTALLSLTGPTIGSWQAAWVLLALMNVFILPNVWTAAVSSLFSAGRGLALAVTLCGSGIGSMITPLLAVELIDNFGWRHAYVWLAASWGLVVIPLLLLCFRGARDRNRREPRARPVVSASSERFATVRATLMTGRFFRLALATLLIASVVVPLAVTLVPILSSNGLERGRAAAIASMLGIASITGRLTIGFLLDHINGRILAATAVSIPILSCAILILVPGSPVAATAAVLTIGLALGAELDLVAYLASRYFSVTNFGLVFGTLAGVVNLGGSGLGPLAFNSVFDHANTYVPALWGAIPMCLASALLFLTLGPYPQNGEVPAH